MRSQEFNIANFMVKVKVKDHEDKLNLLSSNIFESIKITL